MESDRLSEDIDRIQNHTRQLCELLSSLRDEVSDSGRKAAFVREVVLIRYRDAVGFGLVNTHEIMRVALDNAEQLWMALPEEYR